MKFWDASALIPLIIGESSSSCILALARNDPLLFVWWGSCVECASAIARREREGALTTAEATRSLGRLNDISDGWNEILPTDAIRSTAQRILRVHPLRAADACQLSAAIIASEHEPRSLEFVCLDNRLCEAADKEGFPIVRPN
jgi:hypothetical protein